MTPRSARILFLSFAAAVALGVAVWAARVITRLSVDEQRALAATSTVWGCHACIVAIIAGLAALARPLLQLLGRRRAFTALGLAVGGWFACGVAPEVSRIFFDEHIYMQIGQTIAHTGRAETANYARADYGRFEMIAPMVNKQPNGLPYLLSWIYRVAGISDFASHFLNRALTGLAAAALYLGLSLVPWTLPRGTGLAAGILFLLTPLVVWWGHTVAVEPGAACTAAFAFFAACLHARLRDRDSAQGLPASALLLAGAIAFAAYFRPESLLVFPVAAAVLWSTDDRFIEDLSAWGALVLGAALAVPNLLHLWSMRTEDWGARDGRRFATDFVSKNFHSNGGYFIDSHWFPIAGTVFALLGALWLLKRNRTAGIALGLWFAISWGIFVLFYAGGYYYGVSSRYGVVSCAPVAVFMGIGLAALYARLPRSPLAVGALGAAAAINWAAAFHYVPTRQREGAEAQRDAEFVERAAAQIPDGSLVITPDPCMWLLREKNAAQFFTIDHQLHHELRELANQFPGGVYVHWSFWHNAEPTLAHETAQLLADTQAAEILRFRTQSNTFALYRIDTPAGFEKFGGPPPPPPKRDTDLDTLLTRAKSATP